MPFGLSAGATAALIGAGGAAVGGGLSALGSMNAANTAAGASRDSLMLQNLALQYSNNQQWPFIHWGTQGADALQAGLFSGDLGQKYDLSGQPTVAQVPQAPALSSVPQFSWDPTVQQLEQMPGYQFQLDQGLKSVQNAAAARGLGVSGAALKAAENFASGLAQKDWQANYQQAADEYAKQLLGQQQGLNTYAQQLAGYGAGASQYQNMFTDYWANQNNRYDNLLKLASLGANTATNQGTQTVNSAANQGNALMTAGAVQGAGQAAAGNALSGALTNYLQSPQFQNWVGSPNGPSSWFGGGSYGTGVGTNAYINPTYQQANWGAGINAGLSPSGYSSPYA